MLDLTKENFAAEVLEAEGKVFVDFYGDGCVPCAALMPFVHQYAEEYGDKMVKIVFIGQKLDRDSLKAELDKL